MLYIGSFSYNDANDANDNYCLLPSVVEASSSDEALEKFAAKFRQIREESDLLEGAEDIYLDSLIELDGSPEDPVICQWQKIVPADDGCLCGITGALPDGDADGTARAVGWNGLGDDELAAALENLGELEVEEKPFLEF